MTLGCTGFKMKDTDTDNLLHVSRWHCILKSFDFCVTLPANKVSDDISMANIDFNTVSNLIDICPVDVFPEGSLNARTILEKLLFKNGNTTEIG